MNVSMENKKIEAIKRMKALKIFNQTIRQFERENLVSCSEPPMGANYWIDEEQEKLVKAFEEEYNALVYFVVRSYTAFGKLDAFLYVSDYEEEWEMDNEDINDGYVMSYVHNYDMTDCSEFGSIGVQERFGGLVRTA